MSDRQQRKQALYSALRRALLPHHAWKAWRLQRTRKLPNRAADDAQLLLYSKILPGGFLHYGYFENPEIRPEDISLRMLEQAQEAYALRLVGHLRDRASPVLDIGCGMGGLVRVLLEQGCQPVALTPDRNQVRYVSETHPGVRVIGTRFEDMPVAGLEQSFGTLITSESLQYLKLDAALPLMDLLLKPGGRWLACDYFRTGESAGERSGHDWQTFLRQLDAHGFHIVHEEDVTAHILPTIAFVHLAGQRIALPLWDFVLAKLKVKAPGLNYVLENVIASLNGTIDRNLEIVNPATFAREKRYVLLVMERKPAVGASSTVG